MYINIKEALLVLINALHCVTYIYIRQLSSLRVPMLWFTYLTVATCHIQYTFLSLCQLFFTRKWTKYENTKSPPFFILIQKWPPTVTRRAVLRVPL